MLGQSGKIGSHNLYAYCNNTPVATRDNDGHLALWLLCTIGAVVSGLIEYADQVIDNYQEGKTGSEAWVSNIDCGAIAGAAFSGAISAVPGSMAWGTVIDTVGSNVIEAGVDYMVHKESTTLLELGTDIGYDLATSWLLDQVTPAKDIPKYIRDIKREARDKGIKGTNKLMKYLDSTQQATIISNMVFSKVSSKAWDGLTYVSLTY